MSTTRTFITVIILLSIFPEKHLNGQQDLLFLRGSISTTLSSFQLNFMGETINYHPARGIAGEIGYERVTRLGLHPYLSLGFLLNGQFHYNNTNGFTNRSTFKFNRTYFTGGLNYHINTKKTFLTSVAIGVGGNYNLPSKLILKENNQALKSLSYSPSAGFHFDVLTKIKLTNRINIEPQLRLRIIEFELSSNNLGSLAAVEDYYRNLNVSNLEAGIKASIRL